MNPIVENVIESSDKRKENEKEKVVMNIEENTKNKTNEDKQIANAKRIQDTEKILGKKIDQEKGDGGPTYGDKSRKAYGYRGALLDYDPNNQNHFVRLVLMTLCVMFIVTIAYTLVVLNDTSAKQYYKRNAESIKFCSGLMLLGMHLLIFISEYPRISPFNYISLVIVVILMCHFVGAMSILEETHFLFFAFLANGATVVVCVFLAYSKFDFTKWHLYMVAIVVTILIITVGICIAVFIFKALYGVWTVVWLFTGGLAYVLLMVTSLQTILGGKTVEICEDEYALAAFMIYMAVPDLFLKLMEILGCFDE